MGKKNKIFIFNYYLGAKNPILSFTKNWVSSFQKFGNVKVFSEVIDPNYLSNENTMLKGPSIGKTIMNLIKIFRIIGNERPNIVFFHMTENHALIYAWLCKLLKIKTILWYAHGATNWRLLLASNIVDRIISPTRNSFPYKMDSKLRIIGHGVNVDFKPQKLYEYITLNLKNIKNLDQQIENAKIKIGMVGRFSKVKNYESSIEILEKLDDLIIKDLLIIIIGPIYNKKYYEKIIKKIENAKIKTIIFEGLEREYSLSVMSRFDIFMHNSNTKSLDKVIIEAMRLGNLIYSSSPSTKELLPNKLKKILTFYENGEDSNSKKLEDLIYLPNSEKNKIREILKNISNEHDTKNIAERILQSI